MVSASAWRGAQLCLALLLDGSGRVGVEECSRSGGSWGFPEVPVGTPLAFALASQPGQCLSGVGRDPAVQATFIINRLAPLLQPTAGRIGLIFDLGWLLDLAMDWNGAPTQRYPIDTGMCPQWSNATYSDIAIVLGAVKSAAADAGLAALQMGLLFVGWSQIYQIPEGPFFQRHPELLAYHEPYSPYKFNFSAARSLRADTYPYATSPAGVPQGTSFFDLFGAQFTSTASFLGFDTLVVRDGLSTYANYAPRRGPFGASASPDAAENAVWLEAQGAIFSAVRRACPTCFIVGYSSAAGAVAEARIGLFDLESVVALGAMDAWVDQSWAGSWQDVKDRHTLALGWTHQLQYILAHRAAIAGGNLVRAARGEAPCAHYSVTETFDAYEVWSTIRDVPGKLAWGIWAFNTAALRTRNATTGAEVLHASDGAYLSWMWSWQADWIPAENVTWLATHLAGAQAAGASLEAVFGPTILYNRGAVSRPEEPTAFLGEFIDEAAAWLTKFAIGVHSVARMEESFSPERSDGYLVHAPLAPLPSAAAAALMAAAQAGTPLVLTGRASALDPTLQALAGLLLSEPPSAAGLPLGTYTGLPTAAARSLAPGLPPGPSNLSLCNVSTGVVLEGGTSLLLGVEGVGGAAAFPLLTSARGGSVYWWHAPEGQGNFRTEGDLSLASVGQCTSYLLAAAAFTSMHGARNVTRVTPDAGGAAAEPVAVSVFRSSGTLKVLVGNLESTNVDMSSGPSLNASSATPRSPHLVLRLDHVGVPGVQRVPGACWELVDVVPLPGAAALRARADASGDEVAFDIYVSPHGARILTLRAC